MHTLRLRTNEKVKWNDKTVWTVMDYKSLDSRMVVSYLVPMKNGLVSQTVWDGFRKVGSIGLSSSVLVLLFTFARSLASPWATSLD